MTGDSALAPLLRKLQLWRPLSEQDQAALLLLPHRVEQADPGRYLVREGDHPKHSCLLVSGFAIRQKATGDGARSISAIHFAGDIVDLQNSLLELADHSVQTLTQSTVAYIPVESVLHLAFERPHVGFAMWYDTLVDGSIFREWIANCTRRAAPQRIAHVLCEVGLRLEAVGLGSREEFELPVTQEQLADATGLTPVHVNRTLQELESRGLFKREQRKVHVSDWRRLADAGDFSETYLHLPQSRSLRP
jgi:CRP-like cAMP-binding protein